MTFSSKGILLDIEGTTSSVRFVYDVLFPFARRQLRDYVSRHWGKPDLHRACELIATDAGAKSFAEWTGQLSAEEAQAKVVSEIERLMDGDIKATGLKELQGLIWRDGYATGELRSHVYDDVPPALQSWNDGGKDVRIYSSGSIMAQKQFFSHTERGDLTHFLHGHYDTTTGPKKEAASYRAIADHMELPPAEILFVSDVVAELNAAAASGMQTALCVRPGNATVLESHAHPTIRSLLEIQQS